MSLTCGIRDFRAKYKAFCRSVYLFMAQIALDILNAIGPLIQLRFKLNLN